MKKEIKEYSDEMQKVYIEIPVLKGFNDSEYEGKINNELYELCSSVENEFLNEASKESENRIGIPELEIKCDIKINDSRLFSLEILSYLYTDGAVGTYTKYVKNIDLRNNTEIRFENLFNDDEHKKLLNSKLEQKSKDAIYSDLWETPTIKDNQSEMFYFTKDGLVIFYPPYELSYYARGFVEFTIEYSQLYGYLSPDYTFLYNL